MDAGCSGLHGCFLAVFRLVEKVLVYFGVVWYNYRYRGVAQLVARSVWDAEVACSSQVAPTTVLFVKNDMRQEWSCMLSELVNPWLEVTKQKNPPYLAKCDREIKLADFYNLHVELLPQPYLGDVLSARVICLLLNPGCSGSEDNIELNCCRLQKALRDNLSLSAPRLVYLDDEFDWTSGGKWMRQKILDPLSKHGVTRNDLNRNFAIVEYFPYHSRTFDVRLGAPLESQRYGFELVRRAIRDNAIILLMRGKELWREAVPELQEFGNCIIPHSTRNVILSERNLGKEQFAKVVEVLKS